MIAEIGTIITAVVGWFTEMFGSLASVFFDGTKLTAIGTVLFIGVGTMLVMMALRWVLSLVRGI